MSSVRRFLAPTLLLVVVTLMATALTAQRSSPRRRSDDRVRRPMHAALDNRARARVVTGAQRDRANERVAIATAIVNRFAAEAKARGLSSGWRQAMLETLLPLGVDALRRVEQQAVSLDAIGVAVADTADDPSLIGDSDRDLTFTPVVPCRFIDTRSVGGKIAGVREFNADLTGASYGGSGACNLLSLLGVTAANQIGALAMNVTIVDTTTSGIPGFLAVKPTAASPTTSLLNWYDAGAGVQVANQGVAALNHTPPNEFVIQTSGAVHVIVDIFGGFVSPAATTLETIVVTDSITVPAGEASDALFSPECPSGYAMTGGGCGTGDPLHHLEYSTIDAGIQWLCYSRNQTAQPSDLFVDGVCSRVPGR